MIIIILSYVTEIFLFCLWELEHSLYYNTRSSHVFWEIASQQLSGKTAVQKNSIESREIQCDFDFNKVSV